MILQNVQALLQCIEINKNLSDTRGMEQQQFRVKFPLGTKLVLSLSLLFAALVAFLSVSAVLIMIEDKQAYTYQLTSMEAYVASRDFSEKTRLSLDNLRLYLTAFDPRQAITPAQAVAMESVVKNQMEAAVFQSYQIKSDGTVKKLTETLNPEIATRISFQSEQLQYPPGFFLSIYPKLLENNYAFANINRAGMPAVMLVAYADVGLKNLPDGMPVAVALVDLSLLKQSRRSGDIVIAQQDGSVLYSSTPELVMKRANVKSEPLFQAAMSAKTQAGTREFTVDEIRRLGAFQKTSFGPVVTTQMEWKKAMAAAYTLAERFVLLGIVSVSIAVLFAIVFSNTITKPLKRLYRATAQITKGDFNVDPNVNTKDEVGQLSNSFVAMSKKIQELLIETVKKAQMQEELKVAAAVQESLIPPPEYRDGEIEILGHYQSASECGGDWWGFFRVGNKVVVMIADATGHGVPSALVTASARSCFSVLHKLAREKAFFRLAPGELMSYANRVIFDAATTKIMMTFFIGVVDLDTKTITYSNAGHNPPWLFRKNGERYVLKSLVPKGNRLGETEESGLYEEMSVPMEEGDILLMYTDGLMENKNLQSGEQYGKKRAKQVVEGALPSGPQAVLDALIKDYREYNEGKHLDDDVTLATVRILSSGGQVAV